MKGQFKQPRKGMDFGQINKTLSKHAKFQAASSLLYITFSHKTSYSKESKIEIFNQIRYNHIL